METRIPNNSDASRTALEKKEDTRVVNKPVVQSKVKHRLTIGKLFRQTFIPEDVSDAKEYMLTDIIMPALKNGIFDTVMNIVDFWRGGGGTYRRTSNSNSFAPRSRVSQQYDYNRVSSSRIAPSTTPSQAASKYSYDDIVIEDYPANQGGSAKARADAESVLVSMQGIIDRYSVVRIQDLYDLVGLTGNPTDYDYGWSSLNGATVQRVSGGWLLVLPKAMPIDNV